MTTSPEVPSALEAPGARMQLVATRAAGIASVVIGCLLVVAVLIGWPVLHRHYERTQDRLDRYPGEVVDLSRDDPDHDDGNVVVQYVGPGGPQTRVAVHDIDEWFRGRRVDVLVDPADPTVITVRGENFLPEWYIDAIVSGLVIAAVLLIGGLVAWYRSDQRIRRKSRSPWTKAFGSAITVQGAETKTAYAYFPVFAPDLVWHVSKRVPSGRILVELAGDRSGAVLRLPGSTTEFFARPRPLLSLGTVEIRSWRRVGSLIAMRVGNDVYVADDDEFAELVEEHLPPVLATVQRTEPTLGVVTLTDAYRAALVRRLDPPAARKAWPDLYDAA
jgi:hypothetical protein